jgi:AcrR family transcriptional regulator
MEGERKGRPGGDAHARLGSDALADQPGGDGAVAGREEPGGGDSTAAAGGGGPSGDGRPTRASARRAREREIVEATRSLFDERGVQDAPIEDIARAVGINKALIYRHFASKEELFVLTVTSYLDQLARGLGEINENEGAELQLRDLGERFADFCLEYPAFIDCAQSLMRRPFEDLAASVSPAVLLRLGQTMATCLAPFSRILALGNEQGVFDVDDPDYVANHIYAQALGAMHLGRVGAGVRELAPGVPEVFPVDPQRVKEVAIAIALAYVLRPPAS